MIVYLAMFAATLPMPGHRIKVPKVVVNENRVCMTSSAQIDACFTMKHDGVEYVVAYRGKSRWRRPKVTYVHTKDPKFVLATGTRVNDFLEVTYDQIRAMPGYEIYCWPPSRGWLPLIGFNSMLSEHTSFESRVRFGGTRRVQVIGFKAR